MVREIPLTNLARLVDALEQLAGLAGERLDGAAAALVGQVFTAHDALDGALVGAEDVLAAWPTGSTSTVTVPRSSRACWSTTPPM